MNAEKTKALELAIGQIDRHFGKGAVMRLGESQNNQRIQAISTAIDLGIFSDENRILGIFLWVYYIRAQGLG